jgi:hypothetical protein
VGKTLLFDHIPKTGGTTVKSILRRVYNRVLVLDPNPGESMEAFRDLSYSERKSYDVIVGHTAYKLLDAVPEPIESFTMLRRPTSRVVSHYYHVRRNKSHVYHDKARRLRLGEYVSSGVADHRLRNHYCARFSGWSTDAVQEDPRGAFEKAKEQLRDFSLVGITERFDESLLEAWKQFGWVIPPIYAKRNVSHKRPSVSELKDETQRAIREATGYDQDLYDWARDRFEERVNWGRASLVALHAVNTLCTVALRTAKVIYRSIS